MPSSNLPLRITTWNINSIRLRLDHLAQVIKAENPDVLCLQETKVVDDLFPHMDIAALGYKHRVVRGMKSYNGVAILSRHPLESLDWQRWGDKDDCRHVAARVRPEGSAPIDVHSIYIPAGGEKPDPAINPKFAHKLAFLRDLAAWSRQPANGIGRILCGDFNVAPLQTDVWDHAKLKNVVTHTATEIEHLSAFAQAGSWVDAVRHFIPDDEKVFSWWSYRGGNWQEFNRGRRLDHIWVGPELKGRLAEISVLTDARGWERPSDHVPVTVALTR